MTTDLSIWAPPEKELLDKQSQYCDVIEKRNNQEILELTAEQRDAAMRNHARVCTKFISKIEESADGIKADEFSRKEKRAEFRMLVETFKSVADVQARALMFDRTPKVREAEEANTRVNLFMTCAPVGYSAPAIDVQVRES